MFLRIAIVVFVYLKQVLLEWKERPLRGYDSCADMACEHRIPVGLRYLGVQPDTKRGVERCHGAAQWVQLTLHVNGSKEQRTHTYHISPLMPSLHHPIGC